MTLLDVIDLDEILIVNSMRDKKFFEPLAKGGATLVWKFMKKSQFKKIKGKQKKNESYWIRRYPDKKSKPKSPKSLKIQSPKK